MATSTKGPGGGSCKGKSAGGRTTAKVGRYKTAEESGRYTAPIPKSVRHSPRWFGALILILAPDFLKQHWLHAKLTAVLLLLVVAHLEMINALDYLMTTGKIIARKMPTVAALTGNSLRKKIESRAHEAPQESTAMSEAWPCTRRAPAGVSIALPSFLL